MIKKNFKIGFTPFRIGILFFGILILGSCSQVIQEAQSKIKIPDDSNIKMVSIGEKTHGGIVFFVDRSGKHGLVCQEDDLKGLLTFEQAKKACGASSMGQKSDWRLPSMDELGLIHNNVIKAFKDHADGVEWYWSSNEVDALNVMTYDILHGKKEPHSHYGEGDNQKSHARAVRKF